MDYLWRADTHICSWAVWEFFLFFAHSPIAIKPRSLLWVTNLVLSRTFLSLKSSRCTILFCGECQDHYCLLLFLRFHLAFPAQEHCCELLSAKRSILIPQKRGTDSVWEWGNTESLVELLKVWAINERAVCEDHSRAGHYVETHLWCWQCVVTAAVKGAEVYITG